MNQSNTNILPEPEREFEAEDNYEYEIKSIVNNVVYGKKIRS